MLNECFHDNTVPKNTSFMAGWNKSTTETQNVISAYIVGDLNAKVGKGQMFTEAISKEVHMRRVMTMPSDY